MTWITCSTEGGWRVRYGTREGEGGGVWCGTSSNKFDASSGSLEIKIEEQDRDALGVEEDGCEDDVEGEDDEVLDGMDQQ
jgi:hypothetical protein